MQTTTQATNNAKYTKPSHVKPRRFEDVDMSKIVFQSPRRNMNGGLNVDIKIRDDLTGELQSLWIQSPKMRIPFGVTSSANFADSRTDKAPNFSIDLALHGLRAGTNDAMKHFEDACGRWDDLVVLAALQNSQQWFGKERAEATIRELQKSLVKQPRDMKYDPVIKIKMPKSYGKYNFQVYDENNNVISADDLNIGNDAIAIFELKYVWFVGNQFGTSLEGRQFKCFQKDELNHCIVIDDATANEFNSLTSVCAVNG